MIYVSSLINNSTMFLVIYLENKTNVRENMPKKHTSYEIFFIEFSDGE